MDDRKHWKNYINITLNFDMIREGPILKVRQSQDTLKKHYLEHFEKLARRGGFPPVVNMVK